MANVDIVASTIVIFQIDFLKSNAISFQRVPLPPPSTLSLLISCNFLESASN